VEKIKALLAYTPDRAPFDGVVATAQVNRGDLVAKAGDGRLRDGTLRSQDVTFAAVSDGSTRIT